MNRKQKYVLGVTALLVFSSFLIWLAYGGEIFTKTKILVETKDELFGWSEKHWVDKFIWGLDLSLALSAVSLVTGGVIFFLCGIKNKKHNHRNN